MIVERYMVDDIHSGYDDKEMQEILTSQYEEAENDEELKGLFKQYNKGKPLDERTIVQVFLDVCHENYAKLQAIIAGHIWKGLSGAKEKISSKVDLMQIQYIYATTESFIDLARGLEIYKQARLCAKSGKDINDVSDHEISLYLSDSTVFYGSDIYEKVLTNLLPGLLEHCTDGQTEYNAQQEQIIDDFLRDWHNILNPVSDEERKILKDSILAYSILVLPALEQIKGFDDSYNVEIVKSMSGLSQRIEPSQLFECLDQFYKALEKDDWRQALENLDWEVYREISAPLLKAYKESTGYKIGSNFEIDKLIFLEGCKFLIALIKDVLRALINIQNKEEASEQHKDGDSNINNNRSIHAGYRAQRVDMARAAMKTIYSTEVSTDEVPEPLYGVRSEESSDHSDTVSSVIPSALEESSVLELGVEQGHLPPSSATSSVTLEQVSVPVEIVA